MRKKAQSTIEQACGDAVIENTDFLNPAEAERKRLCETGADIAVWLVDFLRRTPPISFKEIVGTRLYRAANTQERIALQIITAPVTWEGVTPEQKAELEAKDNALMCYARGEKLTGRWGRELEAIPAKLAEREAFDRKVFAKHYQRPRNLFSWIWEYRAIKA